MTCEELLELLHDYVNGELVVEHRTTVEVHVTACEHCAVIVESYTHTVRFARKLPQCGLPPDFEARLRATLEPELRGDERGE